MGDKAQEPVHDHHTSPRLGEEAEDAHNNSTFVPGCLNVKADALSRRNQILKQEWSLLQVFEKISKTWDTPYVDLFTTNLNHKLPLYFSPVPDQEALAVDAMNFGLLSFTFHHPGVYI